MIYTQTLRYGIDKQIYNIQESLEIAMSKWSDVHIYGRIKRTQTENGFRAEVQKDDNEKEYTPVFVSDTKGCEVGFYVIDRNKSNHVNTANIDVIFTVDLEKQSRTDEQALSLCEKYVYETGYIQEIGNIKEGVENVFSDFDTSGIVYRDMYPFYIFSFNTTITYSSLICDVNKLGE